MKNRNLFDILIIHVLLIVLFSVGFVSVSLSHPIHVSVTSIEYIESENAYQISMKLFKDDFETIIDYKYQIDTDINNCMLNDSDTIYIIKYIEEHFSMKFDGKNSLKKKIFLPITCNEEAIWLSFKIQNIVPMHNVEIGNTLMNDLYNDQKNLVIFKHNDIEKGFQFNKKTAFIEFAL